MMRLHQESTIEVRDLIAGYENETVLHDISLDIVQGEVTSIIGPSGCGKTTLMKIIVGLMRPTQGMVRVLGQDILSMEREELSSFLTNVGVTFQGGALFGSQTVGENVAVPLREHTDLDAEIIESVVAVKLSLVGLEEAAGKMPAELSGGMQKRAAIARAMALEPPVLFFDEPSSGIDPVTSAALDDLILFLNRSLERTVVVITHEIRSAFRISDKIVFIEEGRIVETGTVPEFRHSTNPKVQQFISRSVMRTRDD